MTRITPEWLSAVHEVVCAIPSGQVASYGDVARRAGRPGCARQVARVLSRSDDPGLPWHRVLRSDGRLGLPAGSAGYLEQVARLEAEGVAVLRGRVRMPAPATDLDELVWGPQAGAP